MAKALDLDRLEGVTADTITDEQVRALLNANLDVLMDGEPDYHTRMQLANENAALESVLYHRETPQSRLARAHVAQIMNSRAAEDRLRTTQADRIAETTAADLAAVDHANKYPGLYASGEAADTYRSAMLAMAAKVEALRGELESMTGERDGMVCERDDERLISQGHEMRADDAEDEVAALRGEVERMRARVAVLEESLDSTCETCDGACPHRRDLDPHASTGGAR